MTVSETAILDKKGLAAFVDMLCGDYNVFGPVSKGTEYAFEPINGADNLELEYYSTILPPKKLLHQPLETMFHFTVDGDVTQGQAIDRKQILFGIHPCDAHAIMLLDKVYMNEYPDPYYQQKRENTMIIAINCNTVGETCFCASLGTGPSLEKGFDLLLTDLGEKYLIEAASKEGKGLLQRAGLSEASVEEKNEKHSKVNAVLNKVQKHMKTDGLADILQDNFRHPIWDELAKKCMACGSCTMVCPTCFCYNVVDQMDLDLKQGKRQRTWDSCLMLDFGEVAMGGNFRKDRDARIKQRIYHKLRYMEEQFGMPGCVGCGRCIRSCIKKIDPTKIVEEIRGEDR